MEAHMFRKALRFRGDCIACLLGAIIMLCCNRTVAVTVLGPSELSGASISLDGVHVGEFSHAPASKGSQPTGVFAQLTITRGKHELEIRSSRFPPIIKRLDYRESVHEDYIWITLPSGQGADSTGASDRDRRRSD